MATSSVSPAYTDILVAVHGIGAQMRNATVRSVTTRLADCPAVLGGRAVSLVTHQPLGYFFPGTKSPTKVVPLDSDLTGNIGKLGFVETFWADLPQEAVAEGRTVEETKAWARTVVARARTYCARAKARDRTLVPPDFDLGTEVIDEIIDTIHVIENLLFIADRAGVFHFELRQILNEYVNDVQIVTEFESYRETIVGRFHATMQRVYQDHCAGKDEPARLHIVAHSEGTVVSFLGLLLAMSGKDCSKTPGEPPTEGSPPAWLERVHGFMTIGSPIDKHLLLWPGLWRELAPQRANRTDNYHQIRWRNYYDYGDPVGFKLETAQRWLKLRRADMFEFEPEHDHGFARYLLPGKAHNDYWGDAAVFEHFLNEAVVPAAERKKLRPPGNRPLVGLLSPMLPYLVSMAILMLGVHILVVNVTEFVFGDPDAATQHVLRHEIGLVRTEPTSGMALGLKVAGISVLIAGTTLLARLPRMAASTPSLRRLSRGRASVATGRKNAVRAWSRKAGTVVAARTHRFGRGIWRAIACLGFLASCGAYVRAVTPEDRADIGTLFHRLGGNWPTLGVLLCAFVVGATVYFLTTRRAPRIEVRRERWLRGMRPLMLLGGTVVAILVLMRVKPEWSGWNVWDELSNEQQASFTEAGIDKEFLRAAQFDQKELTAILATPRPPSELGRKLRELSPILTDHPSVWKVMLGTAAFLYLWWLATLLFDLAFVWQRYVRQSVCIDGLAEWAPDDFWDPKKPT